MRTVPFPAPRRVDAFSYDRSIRAKWTNAIHDEWITSLLENRPDLTLTQLTRTRQLMDSHVLEAIVEGYEKRIDKLALPDPDDRHVLAAAIESRSSLIITWNTTDFPDTQIEKYGVTAVTPDEFILDQIELSPELVSQAVRRHKESLRHFIFSSYLGDGFITLERRQCNLCLKSRTVFSSWPFQD